MIQSTPVLNLKDKSEISLVAENTVGKSLRRYKYGDAIAEITGRGQY